MHLFDELLEHLKLQGFCKELSETPVSDETVVVTVCAVFACA
jgi:hypothetical protein